MLGGNAAFNQRWLAWQVSHLLVVLLLELEAIVLELGLLV